MTFEKFRISKLIVSDFQQFNDLEIDLTYKDGRPLEKVCFIGPNGSGKSTLLTIIREILDSIGSYQREGKVVVKLSPVSDSAKGEESIYVSYKKERGPMYFRADVEKLDSWNKLKISQTIELIEKSEDMRKYVFNPNSINNGVVSMKDLALKHNDSDLLVFMPSETSNNQLLSISDVPNVQLNHALNFFSTFPYVHEISNSSAQLFWQTLIYQIKKRESDNARFFDDPSNEEMTAKQLRQEFDKINVKILPKIADIWNRILGKAGLTFDYENARLPVQLNENLYAYIKFKKTGQTIPYNRLSTGIRNYIFKLGHLYSLYHNRGISRGFLFVDEPENSLYPDFLYEMIQEYTQITSNTQAFFATHSPIIAAQFQPEERIILEFDDNGFVTARKGVSPIGDDPNDVLRQDFSISDLMGQEGINAWERYLLLRTQIKNEPDPEKKDALMLEHSKLGRIYNFDN